jgi:hypothetical protein
LARNQKLFSGRADNHRLLSAAGPICDYGHDPEWEHREWLDTATIPQPAHWTRYVLATTRGAALGDENG